MTCGEGKRSARRRGKTERLRSLARRLRHSATLTAWLLASDAPPTTAAKPTKKDSRASDDTRNSRAPWRCARSSSKGKVPAHRHPASAAIPSSSPPRRPRRPTGCASAPRRGIAPPAARRRRGAASRSPSMPARRIDDDIRDFVGPVTEDEKLLQLPHSQRGDFTRTDPWRVMRIMGEFIEGFDDLASIEKGVSIFGSARTAPDDPQYQAARGDRAPPRRGRLRHHHRRRPRHHGGGEQGRASSAAAARSAATSSSPSSRAPIRTSIRW